jgi:hypothetical protein
MFASFGEILQLLAVFGESGSELSAAATALSLKNPSFSGLAEAVIPSMQ